MWLPKRWRRIDTIEPAYSTVVDGDVLAFRIRLSVSVLPSCSAPDAASAGSSHA
jgi:hypothetical protein